MTDILNSMFPGWPWPIDQIQLAFTAAFVGAFIAGMHIHTTRTEAALNRIADAIYAATEKKS